MSRDIPALVARKATAVVARAAATAASPPVRHNGTARGEGVVAVALRLMTLMSFSLVSYV
jgi:hypothetical protein